MQHCCLIQLRGTVVNVRICSDAVSANRQIMMGIILIQPGQAVFTPEKLFHIQRLKTIRVNHMNLVPSLIILGNPNGLIHPLQDFIGDNAIPMLAALHAIGKRSCHEFAHFFARDFAQPLNGVHTALIVDIRCVVNDISAVAQILDHTAVKHIKHLTIIILILDIPKDLFADCVAGMNHSIKLFFQLFRIAGLPAVRKPDHHHKHRFHIVPPYTQATQPISLLKLYLNRSISVWFNT